MTCCKTVRNCFHFEIRLLIRELTFLDLFQSGFPNGKLQSCLSGLKMAFDKITCLIHMIIRCQMSDDDMFVQCSMIPFLSKLPLSSIHGQNYWQRTPVAIPFDEYVGDDESKTWSTSHFPYSVSLFNCLKCFTNFAIPLGPPSWAWWWTRVCWWWWISGTPKRLHLSCWEVKGLLPVLYRHSSECHWKCPPWTNSVRVFANPNLEMEVISTRKVPRHFPSRSGNLTRG